MLEVAAPPIFVSTVAQSRGLPLGQWLLAIPLGSFPLYLLIFALHWGLAAWQSRRSKG